MYLFMKEVKKHVQKGYMRNAFVNWKDLCIADIAKLGEIALFITFKQ